MNAELRHRLIKTSVIGSLALVKLRIMTTSLSKWLCCFLDALIIMLSKQFQNNNKNIAVKDDHLIILIFRVFAEFIAEI